MLLIFFAFIAGIITIISPCILPVLPIILSTSIEKGKSRPFGIISGFVVSFVIITLFISYLVRITGITTDLLRNLASTLVILMGISMAIPALQHKLEFLLSSLISRRNNNKLKRKGLVGGILVGFTLAIVWTPCVGPIIASVISLAIAESISGLAVFIVIAYTIGTSLPMLGIILLERKLIDKLGWLKRNTLKIQRGFAIVMIFFGIGLFFDMDRKFQTWILNTFPGYEETITSIEENDAVFDRLDEMEW